MNQLIAYILKAAHIVKLTFQLLGNLKMENDKLNNDLEMAEDASATATGNASTDAAETAATPSDALKPASAADVAGTIEGGLAEAGVHVSAKKQGYVDFAMKILDMVGHALPAKESAEFAELESIIEEAAEGAVKTEDAGIRMVAWVKKVF